MLLERSTTDGWGTLGSEHARITAFLSSSASSKALCIRRTRSSVKYGACRRRVARSWILEAVVSDPRRAPDPLLLVKEDGAFFTTVNESIVVYWACSERVGGGVDTGVFSSLDHALFPVPTPAVSSPSTHLERHHLGLQCRESKAGVAICMSSAT